MFDTLTKILSKNVIMMAVQFQSNSVIIRTLFSWAGILGLMLILIACDEGEQESAAYSASEAVSLNSVTADDEDAGWELLFDGESLSGWRGLGRDGIPEDHWIVEEGVIRKVASAEIPRAPDGQPVSGGDILFDRPFDNFELSFEWKVSPGANSGIKYNVSEELSIEHTPSHAALGFEYQVLDDDLHPDAENDPNRLAAGLYDLIPPGSNAQLSPVGSWNTGKIVFSGNRGEHWLNGEMVLEYELGTHMMNRLLRTSKWDEIPEFGERRPSGYIVLQDHGDDVWFRNIKIREL